MHKGSSETTARKTFGLAVIIEISTDTKKGTVTVQKEMESKQANGVEFAIGKQFATPFSIDTA